MPEPEASAARTRALATPFLALTSASAAAVWAQDFSGALPLGLFNEERSLFHALSWIALLALVAMAGLFATEVVRGRTLRAAGAARGLLVALLITEAIVTVFDLAWVATPRGAGFGGPYREAVGAGGTRVFLKRPHPGSPLGFRTGEPHAHEPEARRVLFLGDSYTEGSGRDAACNYPEVAVAELHARGLSDWDGMNAGVAGYGPEDALALFRYLRQEGYGFDAVVVGLFLENDFTDNLPATERRVVAGINFRFPRAAWLRALHPLNTRTFRYGVFGVQASRMRGARDDFARRGDGRCRPPPALDDPLPTPLRSLVERRLARNYTRPLRPLAEDVVARSLRALAAETGALGVPLVVVVFPDRVLADAALRSALGLVFDEARHDPERLRRWLAEHARGLPVIDLTDALAAAPGSYRPSDTHLSDPGNVVAGREVGARLAALLTSTGSRSNDGR